MLLDLNEELAHGLVLTFSRLPRSAESRSPRRCSMSTVEGIRRSLTTFVAGSQRQRLSRCSSLILRSTRSEMNGSRIFSPVQRKITT